MFSYLPLRTYVLSLLIIGSIFSLKGQEKEQEAPEEQPITRYKGFKLEFSAPFNRLAFYRGEEGGFGLGLLAPQYYIRNNISVGLQYENHLYFSHIFMATGDYYFTNGKYRPALGLGVGLNHHETFVDRGFSGGIYRGGFYKSINTLVLSTRFKFHLDWFNFNLNYDVNIHRQVPHSFQFGIGYTLFGKEKKKKQPIAPEEEEDKALEEQTIKRYNGWKLELAAPLNRIAIYQDGSLGFGVAYLAPQYYIKNNISVGLHCELDAIVFDDGTVLLPTFMATGDYYLTNGAIRPSLGLGVGTAIVYWVFSPRFKLHLPWITLHSSYDINISEDIPNSFRLGVALTLFGKAKEKKPKSPKEEKEEALKRYKGFKLELGGALNRIDFYEELGLFGFVIAYLAPQHYINNNISVGLQYEFDITLLLFGYFGGDSDQIFMATGDYYFGNKNIRPALGLGVGVNRAERKSSLVLSPRFKLHLDSFILHLGYDINTHEEVPNGGRLGVAFTLFGKKK